ncbi:hypothetical protein ACNPQN_32725 [Streptomyces sp. NPDC056297]|uniref:hypothetical protein n=1 Tax=unclassified Streptomyces TaxID=2593676 RepID=UPI0035E3B960
MRITFDTRRDSYSEASRRLRAAYAKDGTPHDTEHPRPRYAGKLVLEPLPRIGHEPEPGTEQPQNPT